MNREGMIEEKAEEMINQCLRRPFHLYEMKNTIVRLGKKFSLFRNLKPVNPEDKIKVKDFLKQQPVVYFLYHKDKLVYIGMTGNLYNRMLAHVNDGVKEFDSFATFECDVSNCAIGAFDLEQFLIEFFKTEYNGILFQKKT